MIFRDFEQKIIKNINESGMSIDAIYFIMKNIMREIEEKYFEFCRQEDIEYAKATQEKLESEQVKKESNSKTEELSVVKDEES